MRRTLLILLAACLLPTSAVVARGVVPPASFRAGDSLVATTSSPGNSYVVGTSVVLTAPVAGDFAACGGSIVTAAPIEGDGLLLGGSISSRSSIAGDLRLAGGTIDIAEPIGGDLLAFGFSVHDAGRVEGSAFLVAVNATLSNGAAGPVTIYANNVALAGEFSGNVTVYAGGHVTLAPNTVIHGKFSYEAPDTASIPASVITEGGRVYTNASYLPDTETSRILAFVSIGFFLIARIMGALILAGLFAGLFPRFAELVIDRVESMRPRNILLTLLLGFGISVATPIVIALLLLTFVGIGLAFLLLVLYAFVLILALMYAGITIGGMLVRRFASRDQVLWHDGVLGMMVFSLATLVPFVGFPLILLLMLFFVGTLLQVFFNFAFSHNDESPKTF